MRASGPDGILAWWSASEIYAQDSGCVLNFFSSWHDALMLVTAAEPIVARPGFRSGRAELGLNALDREIMRTLALEVRGGSSDFNRALEHLEQIVRQRIPAGRIFLLGASASGPIVGSVRTGVGLMSSLDAIKIVRVGVDQQLDELAPLSWAAR